MNHSGVAAMHRRQGAPDPVRIGRGQDQVDVVGHQNPGPDLHIRGAAGVRQKVPVQRIVRITKERLHPAVATLRDMMRHARDHEARKAAHTTSIVGQPRQVNLVHCHRNSKKIKKIILFMNGVGLAGLHPANQTIVQDRQTPHPQATACFLKVPRRQMNL
jgi:hypothetical protein